MSEDVMLRAMALKVISAFTKEQYEQARVEAATLLGPGDRRMVRSPLGGAKLGPVIMSDPKPTAAITDMAALRDWMSEHYPEHVETDFEVVGSERAVIDVLFQHAPHLLGKRRQIKAEVVSELRKESAALGQPVGPGGEADVPGVTVTTAEGVVSCRPSEDALLAVLELVGAQRMLLDGTLRPEIEASNG